MVAKALTQAELDALLKSLAPAERAEELQAEPAVRKYDFRRPGKFGKDQLRTLVMMHENLARWLASFFVTNLRSRVQVAVRGVSQYAYSELVQSMSNPTVLGTITMEPLPGTCLVELSSNVAFALLERVFGGAGGDEQPRRPLSDVEHGVMHRLLQELLPGVAQSWRNVAEVQPRLTGLESNPLFVQAAPPAEAVATVNLSLRLEDHVGHLLLAYPFTTVEPVAPRLSPYAWFTRPGQGQETESEPMRAQVLETEVELSARLGQVRLSVGQFLGVQPGDVLVLNRRTGADVELYVAGQPAFVGQPGQTGGGRLAVKIERRV